GVIAAVAAALLFLLLWPLRRMMKRKRPAAAQASRQAAPEQRHHQPSSPGSTRARGRRSPAGRHPGLPTMGHSHPASPARTWLDQALAAALPDAGRLVLWGLFAAAVSMALYAVLSPQHRLRRVREEAIAARRALDEHEGSFEEARPLMARMFATSMKQL